MGVNKLVVDGTTKFDLSSDTVTANSLLTGVTAHDKSGNIITGTVTTVTVYSGTGEPTASTGNVGDLYLVLEG